MISGPQQTHARLSLAEIGLGPEQLLGVEALLQRRTGLLLVTGPAGSGLTTTLYAMLSRLNTRERSILTVEDPIEYEMAGLGQMQVAPKIGLHPAAAVRAAIHQDPDVLLIGAIRDRETAELAVQAAVTKCLVLAAVHTNEAVGAIQRLADIGIEPVLVAAALEGVIAQRLVRVLCRACHEKGCASCDGTGFRGRTGLFELLRVNDRIREQIARELAEGSDGAALRRVAAAEGMRTLWEHGLAKVAAGITTRAEVSFMAPEELP